MDGRRFGMTSVLSAHRLSAGYHGVPAVRDIDISVAKGQMVLLAGANGAGKTTTLMALAGAVSVLSGTVEFNGQPTTQPMHQRIRRGLGVITENRSVIMSLTVSDNLRLGRGSSSDALDHFPELKARLNVAAGLISGGEQQMLSVARVIAAKPKVILADELSLGLAPVVVKRLLTSLRAVADSGTAVLLVEQHIYTALQMVDFVYFLRGGRIHLSGPASEMRGRQEEIQKLYL
jgi:branched-chain amino acid transport system ATP-binding protein